MEGCQEAVYSEEYEDYIIEYSGQEDGQSVIFQPECYQVLGMGFSIVYQKAAEVVPEFRDALLMRPRCFGLLSSDRTLEEAGIKRIRNQPRLELFGRGVLFGIIDTGAGVSMRRISKRQNLEILKPHTEECQNRAFFSLVVKYVSIIEKGKRRWKRNTIRKHMQ